jgi:hypothetical protein
VTSCCNTENACEYANDLSLPGICFSSSQVRDILAVEFQLSACTLSHVTAIPLSLPLETICEANRCSDLYPAVPSRVC